MERKKKFLAAGLALMIVAGGTFFAARNMTKAQGTMVQQSVASVPKTQKALVVYFTYAENIGDTSGMSQDAVTSASLHKSTQNTQGNIQVMVSEIRKKTGADAYSIVLQDPYDPTFDNMTNRAKEKIQSGKNLALKNPLPDFSQYDVIYLGTPIWWYSLPAPVSSFLKQADLSGKTIVPFGIHRGSGFNKNLESIQQLQPKAKLTNGFTIDAETPNKDVQQQFDSFLDGLLK